MERLEERLVLAIKALSKFQEIMVITNPTSIERDAAIHRFEFTFEALWKAAKEFLYVIEGIDAGSPKGVIRACREVGLLDDTETVRALEMVNDGNLTVHTYNEALAKEIYCHLAGYVLLMEKWLKRLQNRIK